jgi:hypothetical protein
MNTNRDIFHKNLLTFFLHITSQTFKVNRVLVKPLYFLK